jgi:hypothetical protein
MAISFGPKLGLLYNALIGESYFDSLRIFLQSIDALVQGSVINATQSAPPSSPSGGDAYLLTGGTPSGAWTGQSGNIAVWDAQLTNSGTNTVVPGWIFLTPKAGWTIWNVALTALYVYNGSAWNAVGGTGANFPTNTDITSMTGIPNTSISTTGYVFGPGPFDSGSCVQIANQSWPGTSVNDYGVGVSSSTEFSLMYPNGIATSGTVTGNTFDCLGNCGISGGLQVGTAAANAVGSITARGTSNNSLLLGGAAVTGLLSVLIDSGTGASPVTGTGLLGFNTNYPTQTTVGAAGSASTLPVAPTGYLQIAIHGTEFVIPYYANA